MVLSNEQPLLLTENAKKGYGMGLFKRKKKEDTLSFKIEMATKIANHRLRYISERVGDTDIIIGRNGGFNIRGEEFIVSADNHVVFRCRIPELQASELMSLEGAILTAPDLESGGKMRTVIAYYVYYR